MKPILFSVLLISSLCGSSAEMSFNKDIRPILSDKCFACHGPDAHDIKGKLQLHTFDLAAKERHYTSKSGKKKVLDAVIIPENPEASLLWERLITDDEDEIMPPLDSHKSLSKEEKATIKQWIKEGAEYEAHWSYEALKTPEKKASIDSLINTKLKTQGLKLNSEAGKLTLIRRLSFDLRGLPPSQTEINQFLRDKSAKSWELLIDRFLEDQAYGEKMAVHWLDIVRFADTVGYHGDQNQRIYPYRDYVINAFNSNKGFDDFTREQLAGDLLSKKPTEEQLVASAYNRLNMMTSEGGAQAKEYLAKYAGDRVRTTTTAWMGSTLGCAECHDHKYDPFTAKDYYTFSAFFADIKQAGVYQGQDKKGYVYPPIMKVLDKEQMTKYAPVKNELDRVEEEIKNLSESKEVKKAYKQWLKDFSLNADTSITDLKSTAGASFEKLSDGSFLREKKNTHTDDYIISIQQKSPANQLMFAFLVDERYGNKLGVGNGNFVLTGLELSEIDKNGKKVPIKLNAAEADFSQAGFAVTNLLNNKKGWAVSGHTNPGVDRHLVLSLERPVQGELEAVLKFQSQHRAHMAGRFAVDLSTTKTSAQHYALLRHKSFEAFTRLSPVLTPLYKELETLNHQAKALDYGKTDCQITETVKPMLTRILPRGNWQDESGEIVEPAIPAFLGEIKKEGRANRLDLANWLVSDENPLTARVFVNRLWYLYFGRGLSQVVEDLGSQGETPDNPELLDYLAWDFRDSNWNVKKAVKLIVMSKAYRQSTERDASLLSSDPFNKKLARQNPRRLEAEFIRDNILKVSGLLNEKVGGRSIKPYQPAGYYAQLNFPKRTYLADTDENQYRKGLYIHRQRTFLHPMLKAFDTPSADTCNARRSVSNTPLQSLALLNDPSFLEAAGAFAMRAMDSKSKNKLKWMLERALNRPAEAAELTELFEFYKEQKAYFSASPQAVDKFLVSLKITDASQMDKIELASYGSIARLIFNLHETLSVY